MRLGVVEFVSMRRVGREDLGFDRVVLEEMRQRCMCLECAWHVVIVDRDEAA